MRDRHCRAYHWLDRVCFTWSGSGQLIPESSNAEIWRSREKFSDLAICAAPNLFTLEGH